MIEVKPDAAACTRVREEIAARAATQTGGGAVAGVPEQSARADRHEGWAP
jgi:hypothetical protein